MAKEVYKTVCDTVTGNKNNSTARFVIELPPVKDAKGNVQRVGKTVITAIFLDPTEAMKFKNGKPATITIEQ